MTNFKFSKSYKIVAATMLGLALAACGGNDTAGVGTNSEAAAVNQTGWPIVDEPITLSMMGPHMGLSDWSDMPFFIELAEKTNINFDFTTPPTGDFSTNLNLALNSGQLPDVILGAGMSAAQQIEFGSQGMLLPLQDLIEQYAPNLSRLLAENPEIRQNITAPDGNIYALPQINQSAEASWMVQPMWYNGTWLDALDAEVPTTLDEFTALMLRFRDEMPEIIGAPVFPISDGLQWVHARNWMLSVFGITTRAHEVIDGTVQFNATTDNYRAYLEWMRMAFEEGILHPEIFSLSSEQNSALGQNNQVGFFQSWYSMFFLQQTDEEGLNNPMFRPLISDWAPTPVIQRAPGMAAGTFVITNTNPSPEATMRWVDFFYSEEGSLFSFFGPEGAYYERAVNSQGEEVFVVAPGRDLTDDQTRGVVTPFYGFPGPHVLQDFPPVLPDASTPADLTFRDFIAQETANNILAFGKVPFPPTMLLAEEADQIALINADLNMFLEQQEAAFITGQQPLNDDTWAAFQQTLENIGVGELVDVWQTAFDRR
ncbi:MAG: extracellular solute-binding protein [Turicibacter sp.]|nr:extracellular solute-binding protein [Turicibacter sp.]